MEGESIEMQSLPAGWIRDETGGLRRETQHRMGRRCLGWDYKLPGSYEITLTMADRSGAWLGVLGTHEQAREHEGEREGAGAYIEPTKLGEVVAGIWRELGVLWPGVEPRELQLMPEHLHGILRVKTPQKHPLGQIIGSFKAKTTSAARELASKLASTGGASTGRGNALVPSSLLEGKSLWAPGFNDAILWDIAKYRRERDYLLDNPRRLWVKRAHPMLFRVLRDIEVAFRPGPETTDWHGPSQGHFAAIGNHFLLTRPDFYQVQCSRADFAYRRAVDGALLKEAPPLVETAAFRAKRDEMLSAGKRGAVIVSPCISHGERELARVAFKAGYSVVTLQNKGFSPMYKPGGKLFAPCASGNLLMLAPIAWPYLPGEKRMTREDAQILNRLAQLIAGEGAAKIDYKGAVMSGVDELTSKLVSTGDLE